MCDTDTDDTGNIMAMIRVSNSIKVMVAHRILLPQPRLPKAEVISLRDSVNRARFWRGFRVGAILCAIHGLVHFLFGI